MGCSQPNTVAARGQGAGVKFLGPRVSEDDPNYFRLHRAMHGRIDVPCGHCDLCLVTRRYERALRIMLEVESFPTSSFFLTLTYSDLHLLTPELEHSDWQQFMKDFRRVFCQAQYCKWPDKRKQGRVRSYTFKKIKQVMAGEYGDHFGRKHFHGIIFNHVFTDMAPTGTFSQRGNAIHTSPSLEAVWGKGFVQIEPVNMDLALYVSSYITDKGMSSLPDAGRLKKQYGRFGRGIGRSWLEKYWQDVLNAGKLMLREGDYPIPRAFLKWFKDHPDFVEWKARKALTVEARTISNIRKEDGPLRRARAKGRIFEHIHLKKERDYAIRFKP